MKKLNKKSIVLLTTLFIICIVGIVGYIIHNKNSTLTSFTDYLNQYKSDLNNYVFDEYEEKYLELIKTSELIIINKDIKNINHTQNELSNFKNILLDYNNNLIKSYISELNEIDISELTDTNSITSRIQEIELLGEENNFIEASKQATILKDDINKELEIIAEEKYKNSEEYVFNNIDGTYIYEKYNKNNVVISNYYLNVISYGDNKLSVNGGHNAIKSAGDGTHWFNIDDLTEDQLGYISSRSGSFAGDNLNYIGNLTWEGVIWSDQGYYSNVYGDSGPVPTIPIKITVQDYNLIVSIGEAAAYPLSGTNTLIKSTDDYFSNSSSIEKRKQTLEENSKTMSEYEAYCILSKNVDVDKIQRIKISSKLPFNPSESWGLDTEEYYIVYCSYGVTGKSYLIGKDSKKIYYAGTQGSSPVYLLENGEKVQTYEYIGR